MNNERRSRNQKTIKILIGVFGVLLTGAAAALVVLIIATDTKNRPPQTQQTATTPSDNMSTAPQTTAQPPATTQPPATEPPGPPWPPAPSGEYTHLFPDLYAVNSLEDVEYINDERYVYLTFDDGPGSYTSSILDKLKKHDIKATFFVFPRGSNWSNDLLKRIVAEGHTIGIHTSSHVYREIYASVEAYLDDFNTTRNAIYEQTGIWVDFFRFPGGSINNFNKNTRDAIFAEMERRGFVYFDWNVDSGDTGSATAESMLKNIPGEIAYLASRNLRSVVLFHDIKSHTNQIMDELLGKLKANGYTFATIDMKVKPMKWGAN